MRFNGITGTAWQARTFGGATYPGYSDYSPPGSDFFYTFQGSSLTEYTVATDSWSPLAAAPTSVSIWAGMAWVGSNLYVIRGGYVLGYAIPSNTWTTLATGVADTGTSMTTHDASGHVYAFTSDSRVVDYNIATGAVTYHATSWTGGTSESRIAFDPISNLLYIAPIFYNGTLLSFDPVSNTTTTLPPQPEGFINDVYCSDRSGHIYAAGLSSGTEFWQYTIATRTWARIPDTPFDHGNNGGCTITDAGYLYFTNGSGSQMARIQLLP